MACNKFDGGVSLARDFSIFISEPANSRYQAKFGLHVRSPFYVSLKKAVTSQT